ncbi:hypothetical protein AAJCM20276_35490 (plasmid) [Acetobacter aceti]|uniref:Transposase IS116/IS110/IS902 C-terminal domain-containing protein n=1 Tax=Acetobacter aceti TaxID=435 RepID=A0A6S6PQP2_ACEAC|nr:hypothetical protein AAJCM20276_35490 [Acetobacter aceti]
MDAMLVEALPRWSLAPIVRALQALRGVGPIVAITLAAEIGDLSRFETPKQLMGWLGLVPSEASSGTRTRTGRLHLGYRSPHATDLTRFPPLGHRT